MHPTPDQSLTSTVYTVNPETTVAEAAAMMAERNVGALVVVKDMRPIGILTDRDIAVRAVAARRSPGLTPVDKIMSWPLITITQDQDLGSAVALMTRHGIRRLPIVDEQGRLVSILTLDDLLLLGLDGMPVLTEVLRTQLRSGKGAQRPPLPEGVAAAAETAAPTAPPDEGSARFAEPVRTVVRAQVTTPPVRRHRTWAERVSDWYNENLKWIVLVLVLSLLGALALLTAMPFWRALYSYNPAYYEPKDAEREQWLIEREKEQARRPRR